MPLYRANAEELQQMQGCGITGQKLQQAWLQGKRHREKHASREPSELYRIFGLKTDDEKTAFAMGRLNVVDSIAS